jgi:hypothetical protein
MRCLTTKLTVVALRTVSTRLNVVPITDHHLGYYPKYEEEMVTYVGDGSVLRASADDSSQLFDDRSTFRSEIRNCAKQVVIHHYPIIPTEDIPGQRDYMETIADNVERLTKTGAFCHIEQSATQV